MAGLPLSGFSGREHNSWFCQLHQVVQMLKASKQPQAVTLPPPCLARGVMYNARVTVVLSEV